jgi:hypothetical protein
LKTPQKPQPKKFNPKQAREELAARAKAAPLPADPLSPEALKPMALRAGIPLVLLWIGAFVLHGWIPKAVMGVLTLALAGLLLWAVRYAKKSRRVAEIVREVGDTAEARKDAIAKLETDFKKDDTAAVFAKAQLQLQENPREALKTLETIKLDKVLSPVADETRAQRAMIHLILGETDDGFYNPINNRISQSVPHLHVHVIPRRKKDGLKGFFWPRYAYSGEAEIVQVRDAIVAALASP